MEEQTKPSEPVVTVFPNGTVAVGMGRSIGEVLQALDIARQVILGVVLNPVPSERAEN
jgi:hypothetical protein